MIICLQKFGVTVFSKIEEGAKNNFLRFLDNLRISGSHVNILHCFPKPKL